MNEWDLFIFNLLSHLTSLGSCSYWFVSLRDRQMAAQHCAAACGQRRRLHRVRREQLQCSCSLRPRGCERRFIVSLHSTAPSTLTLLHNSSPCHKTLVQLLGFFFFTTKVRSGRTGKDASVGWLASFLQPSPSHAVSVSSSELYVIYVQGGCGRASTAARKVCHTSPCYLCVHRSSSHKRSAWPRTPDYDHWFVLPKFTLFLPRPCSGYSRFVASVAPFCF